ncbi:MAG: hypothetical protein ABIZ56_02805 [Chthoniobacteraceae bacterium]
MKSLLHALLAMSISASAFAAEEKPALPIEKALAIAQDYLKKSGHSVAIAGLSVEKAAFGSKKTRWYAKWVPSIPLDGGRKEFGIEIEMDGTIARIVDKKAPKN